MRILFVKPRYIGDSLILTPTIAATRMAYPKAEIWVVVRKGCEGILTGCNAIDHVITIASPDKKQRNTSSWWSETKSLLLLLKIKFDYIFELGDGHRARWFTSICRSRKTYSVNPSTPLSWFERQQFDGISIFNWKNCHRVEKDFFTVHEFLPLAMPIPPLVFDRVRTQRWSASSSLDRFCVLHIGTRQGFKRWDRDGWLKVGKYLLGHFPAVVISTGPDYEEIAEAEWLGRQLGERALCTFGKTSWPELADLLYRAKLFVGIDTAAMHLAAACQCPTVAIFGPSIEDNWHPWKAPHRIVTSRGFHMAPDNPDRFAAIKRRSIHDVVADDVIAACDFFIHQGRENCHKDEPDPMRL